MAFNELDLKRIEKAAAGFMAAKRPPPHLRDQVDLELLIRDQTIELLEVRPAWNDPSAIHKRAFAKATYVRTANEWRVYWMRGNLKWHPYALPIASSAAQFFKWVEADAYGCFFG